jgi:outer membrane receptor protein involved in Fe transport
VVVTAEKTGQTLEQVTQSIVVRSTEDFDAIAAPNRNLAELFATEPGQFVSALSRNDANWGSFGGLGPKYNGYLLDGLPIDTFVDAMSLDPWAFERAELHKGPASVMYGNYLTMDFAGNTIPLAGITNWVTRDRIDAPATRVAAGYGSWDTVSGRFYHQNVRGNLSAFFGAHYEQSDYTDYGTEPSWLHMVDDPEYRKTKLYGKVMYQLGRDDHRISLFVQTTQHSGNAGRPNRDFQHQYQTVNLAYQNQVTPAVHAQLKIGYRLYDRQWEEDNFPDLSLRSEDSVRQEIFPADLAMNVRHAGGGLLTLGADAQVATYHTFSEPDGVKAETNDASARALGLYAQEKLLLGDWVLRAGGRYSHTRHEYDTLGGAEPGASSKNWGRFLWSGGVRWNVSPALAVYGNAGTSFVVPSAKSVGGTLQASDQGVPGRNGQLPNPDLDPEEGLGLDLGTDLVLGGRVKAGVRGFWHRLDDVIVENVVSTDPSQSRSVNAGEATAYGLELSCEAYLTRALQGFANATWTRTEVENDLDRDQDGADIPFVPDYMVNAGITWNLPWDLTLSPYLRTVGTYYDSASRSGRRAFGGHTVVNLQAAKRFEAASGYAAVLSLDLVNLTDREVEMPWQFQDPGFQWMATLAVEL